MKFLKAALFIFGISLIGSVYANTYPINTCNTAQGYCVYLLQPDKIDVFKGFAYYSNNVMQPIETTSATNPSNYVLAFQSIASYKLLTWHIDSINGHKLNGCYGRAPFSSKAVKFTVVKNQDGSYSCL